MLAKAFCLVVCVLSAGAATAQSVPHSSHVWVINEENHGYAEVVNNSQMPYFNQLVGEYGLAGQFYANQHSSLPALMWYVAGASITANNDTVACNNSEDNVVREVLKKGYKWRSYQEDLPYAGFQGLYGPDNLYYRRHNPLIDFTDACPGTGQNTNSVPLTQMATDFAQTGTVNFAWITPDVNDDAHNGPLQAADEWLQGHVPEILARPEFQPGGDGVLFIVWDEADFWDNSCSSTVSQGCGGRTATMVIGPKVKPNYQSTMTYHAENVLATVCAAMGFATCPGAGNGAATMAEFFYPDQAAVAAPRNSVHIASPASGATVVGAVRVMASASEGQPVTQTQVWDNGVKLGDYGTQINATFDLKAGGHTTTVLDLDRNHDVIRQSSVSYSVVAKEGGVQMLSPGSGASVSGPMVRIAAQANESVPVGQMQVWDNGVKLAYYESANVDQYYSLAPGSHTVTIFDYNSESDVLHESSVRFNVAAPGDGVQVAAPTARAMESEPVIQVVAAATEGVPVEQMQVWDNGVKLGWSGGKEINQQFSVAPGNHTMTVLDLDDSSRVLHGSSVSYSVPASAY